MDPLKELLNQIQELFPDKMVALVLMDEVETAVHCKFSYEAACVFMISATKNFIAGAPIRSDLN